MSVDSNYLKQSLKDVAVEYLKSKILTGEYKAGDRINEVKVAEELNISRAPIREGIKELQSYGLVKQVPRKGSYVVELTLDDIKEIYSIRLSLENSLIDKIVEEEKLSEADFKHLESIVDEMMKIADSDLTFTDKMFQINEKDLSFHRYIWKKANSPRRVKILFDLYIQLQFAMLFDTELTGDLTNTAETHYDIIAYLQSGNAENCKKALKRHIEGL